MTRDDAISREWLKTAIHNFYYGLKHTPTEEDIQAYIDAAPSVSTEKTGRWIKRENEFGLFECSVCKDGYIDQPTCMGKPMFKYCPNCGAKMVEPQESEEISDHNLKMWEEIFKAESEE